MSYPTITINGRDLGIPAGYIRHADVLRYLGLDSSLPYVVSYSGAVGPGDQRSGELRPNEFIDVCDTTAVTVRLSLEKTNV